MKKLIIGATIAFLMALSICGLALADVVTETKNIDITLKIDQPPPTNFGFEIWDSQYQQEIIPYGADDYKKMGHLNMYCTAALNPGQQWRLSVASKDYEGLVGDDFPYIVVPLQLTTQGLGAYSDSWSPDEKIWRKAPSGTGVKDLPITTTPGTIYTSDPATEYVTGKGAQKTVVIEALIYVSANDLLLLDMGTYTGTLIVSMHK